jgi:acetoin utilization protein AcuB
MLVKDWMTKNVSIDQEATVIDAIKVMKEKDVTRIPVTKNGKLIGILTNNDINRSSPSNASLLNAHEVAYLIANLRVKKVMTTPVVTIAAENSIFEATETLLHRNVSGAPVVNHKHEVIGVISRTELTELLLALSGVGAFGIELGLIVKDDPGIVKALTDIIYNHGIRIRSVLTMHDRVPAGYRKVFFKLYKINRDNTDALIEDLKAYATPEYMVDHQNGTRMFFAQIPE